MGLIQVICLKRNLELTNIVITREDRIMTRMTNRQAIKIISNSQNMNCDCDDCIKERPAFESAIVALKCSELIKKITTMLIIASIANVVLAILILLN